MAVGSMFELLGVLLLVAFLVAYALRQRRRLRVSGGLKLRREIKPVGLPPEALASLAHGDVKVRSFLMDSRHPAPAELQNVMHPPSPPGGLVPGLAELQQRDPDFDQLAFLQKASFALEQVDRAQVSGDAKYLQGILSDRMLAEWSSKLAAIPTPTLGGGFVPALSLVRIEQESLGDVAIVRVDASRPEAASHEVVRTHLVQYWSFVRGKNVDRCASCGGPLTDLHAERCPYCGMPLPVLSQDWLIDAISGSPPSGLAA